MCGFISQLVEHRTGIAEVTGSNPVEALIFFIFLLSNCLNWKIHCDDHSSPSSITAVQIYEFNFNRKRKRIKPTNLTSKIEIKKKCKRNQNVHKIT